MFCGAVPLTREHIVPQWLREFFPPETFKLDPEDRMIVTHYREDIPGMSVLEFEDRGPRTNLQDKTVKVVCAGCNGGWMSALELQMKRLYGRLAAGKYTLTPNDVEILARWTHKTSVMWARLLPDTTLDEPRQLHALMAGRAIPGGFVRLIKRSGKHASKLHLHSLQIGVRVPQELMTEPEDFMHPTLKVATVTFVGLGQFVMLTVLAVEDTEPLAIRHLERTRNLSRPLVSGIQWPGGVRAVSDAEFESLHQLFRGKTPTLDAEDESDRPQWVIVEEQRKFALEQRRKRRVEAASTESPTPDSL